MLRRTLAVSSSLAAVVSVAWPSLTDAQRDVAHRIAKPHAHHSATRPGCAKTYSVAMVELAIHAAYSGTRDVSRRDIEHLRHFIYCRRNPMAWHYLRWELGFSRSQWNARRNPPLDYAVASWYDDGGSTASGFHSYYGVAVCGSGGGPCVSFGTKIRFCLNGRCVEAVADDHGPYVSGRSFDLNQNTAAALGFDGVGVVGYHIEQ